MIPLQTALEVPSIDPQIAAVLSFGVVMFVAGMAVPVRYGILRIRGFGRLMASKIPAKPPAGMDREEWLRQAEAGPTPEPDDGDPDVEGVDQEAGADAGGNQP